MRVPVRSPDTSSEAEAVQVDLLRAASVTRRIHLALSLSATVIGLARRAIARANPSVQPSELALRFVELHYGSDVAAGLRAELERRAIAPRPGA
jgi:hypothetical protein